MQGSPDPHLLIVFGAAGSLLATFVLAGIWHLFAGQQYLGVTILSGLAVAYTVYRHA